MYKWISLGTGGLIKTSSFEYNEATSAWDTLHLRET